MIKKNGERKRYWKGDKDLGNVKTRKKIRNTEKRES